jgi:hypothetical protein
VAEKSFGLDLVDGEQNSFLCLKNRASRLETVSTVRGSGWVAVPKCEIAIDYEYDRFTHPLPRTVLTVSKRDFGLLRQRRDSFANR